jgi:exodeoxyribonuclease VII large subunit
MIATRLVSAVDSLRSKTLMTPEFALDNGSIARAILTVSQLNTAVAQVLHEAFEPAWIRGEISNFTCAPSGHWYFTLKDAGAAVRVVMFRSCAQAVGFVVRAGDQVEVRARVTLYKARGEFQLQCEGMRRAGLGGLYEAFLRLKTQLEGEGLFDPARKRVPPQVPRVIGVVTSRQAAALRDVLSVLARRAPQVLVIVYPATVQGPQAAAQLACAVRCANERGEADVLLVVRGGGSIEDLWSFNEEILARAIAASRIPVVSGVGHETDFTIADFVADVRAPTPTAAAELACLSTHDLRQRVKRETMALLATQQRLIGRLAQRVDYASTRLVSPTQRLIQKRAALLAYTRRLTQVLPALVARGRHRLAMAEAALSYRRPDPIRLRAGALALARRLAQGGRHQAARHGQRWALLTARLAAQDPAQPLARGFALVTDQCGEIVRNPAALHDGQRLDVRLAGGTTQVRVIRGEPATLPGIEPASLTR